jgi:hypothetical protein
MPMAVRAACYPPAVPACVAPRVSRARFSSSARPPDTLQGAWPSPPTHPTSQLISATRAGARAGARDDAMIFAVGSVGRGPFK